MNKDDCLFCKIVEGKIPSAKIFEDEYTLAFMDIGPVIMGLTLVIPKRHYDPIMETPADILEKLIVTVQKIAQAQIKGLSADGVNVIQNNGSAAGQEVGHIHFHVIPRFKDDGHHWNWKAGKYESSTEMAKISEQIIDALTRVE